MDFLHEIGHYNIWLYVVGAVSQGLMMMVWVTSHERSGEKNVLHVPILQGRHVVKFGKYSVNYNYLLPVNIHGDDPEITYKIYYVSLNVNILICS